MEWEVRNWKYLTERGLKSVDELVADNMPLTISQDQLTKALYEAFIRAHHSAGPMTWGWIIDQVKHYMKAAHLQNRKWIRDKVAIHNVLINYPDKLREELQPFTNHPASPAPHIPLPKKGVATPWTPAEWEEQVIYLKKKGLSEDFIERIKSYRGVSNGQCN